MLEAGQEQKHLAFVNFSHIAFQLQAGFAEASSYVGFEVGMVSKRNRRFTFVHLGRIFLFTNKKLRGREEKYIDLVLLDWFFVKLLFPRSTRCLTVIDRMQQGRKDAKKCMNVSYDVFKMLAWPNHQSPVQPPESRFGVDHWRWEHCAASTSLRGGSCSEHVANIDVQQHINPHPV